MKFDLMLESTPDRVSGSIERAKREGRDGAWVIEAKHDPFLLLNTAAACKTGLTMGTAVAVALSRTPMLLAGLGNDLQLSSGGNFILGLGTQIKPHIEKRFSMRWDKPVAQMREMVNAIHAIWDSWETSTPLNFTGDYYQHTLMTPAFSPGPNRYGRPPIHLGALGPIMTELAGEVADGLIVHRFVSERFIREVTIPGIERGLAKRKRPLVKPFEIVYPPFVTAADTDEHLRIKLDDARSQIAFYAGTPSYRTVLDMHGWSAAGEALHRLSREKKWAEMKNLITDEMLETFTTICRPDEVQDALRKRFDSAVDRIVLSPESPVSQH